MKNALAKMVAAICLAASLSTGIAASDALPHSTAVQTNWVERWITNAVEIRLQANRFVTEYHTNWVIAVRTNHLDVFATNLVTKTITNILTLDSVRTNYAQAYRTNLQILNLTNWTTVLALKTNWVNKPVTNVVELTMPRESPVATEPTSPSPSLGSEALALQAARTYRRGTNNQVEVQLTVAWSQGGPPVQVQQWRIEREDGSILCFGQEPEFKRSLPIGTYKVLVKVQRDAKSPPSAALGTLTVTSREVLLEQRPARSNSSI